jgi:alkylation response protein AidB-like acyl-CoA dehydrogenase
MNIATSEQESTSLDSEAIEVLRESIADVLVNECDSRAVHVYLDRENDLEATIWRQATDLGWLTLALPEADGGLGMGARGLQVLCRELGERTAPGAFIPTLCAAQWIASVGGDDLRAEVLSAVVTGELKIAVPMLETAGSLSLSNGTVSGEIDVLGSADTGLAVVSVGSDGWAIVRVGGDGASLAPISVWDLTREAYRLTASNAPVAAVIADPDGSVGALLGTYVAIAIAADSLGAANNIAYKTIEYLKERVQFERPIASFQAIKHRASDLIGKITTQDALLEQAVQSVDNGSPDSAMWARLAKAGSTDAFAFVARDCIQLHGGVGHTWEFDPHIYMKRARLNEGLLNNNRALRDNAVLSLNQALSEGRTTTELDW